MKTYAMLLAGAALSLASQAQAATTVAFEGKNASGWIKAELNLSSEAGPQAGYYAVDSIKLIGFEAVIESWNDNYSGSNLTSYSLSDTIFTQTGRWKAFYNPELRDMIGRLGPIDDGMEVHYSNGFFDASGRYEIGIDSLNPAIGNGNGANIWVDDNPAIWNSDEISFSSTVGGSPEGVAAIPEPASWAMMIGGFALVGAAMRRRTQVRVRFA